MTKNNLSKNFKILIVLLFTGVIIWLFASKKVQVQSPNDQTDVITVNDPKKVADDDFDKEFDEEFDKEFDEEFNPTNNSEDITISVEVNGKKTVIRNPKGFKDLGKELENVGREIQLLYLKEVTELMKKWPEQSEEEIKDDLRRLYKRLQRKLKKLEKYHSNNELEILERRLIKQIETLAGKSLE